MAEHGSKQKVASIDPAGDTQQRDAVAPSI